MEIRRHIATTLLIALATGIGLAQSNGAKSTEKDTKKANFERHVADLFTLKFVDEVNRTSSEFGGYPVGNDIYYCSSSRILGPIFRSTAEGKKPLYSLYKAERKNNVLNNPEIFFSLKKLHAGPVCATPDGKTLFVTADNSDVKGKRAQKPLGLYRISLDGELSMDKFEAFKYNSPDYSVGHPTISNDGKTLFFASDMPGGKGGVDLYKVALLEDGGFGPVQNLGSKINTDSNDYFPWIGKDGSLFFSSNGHQGYGGIDVFMAYNDGDNKFSNVTNLGKSVNSEFDEFAFVLLDDCKSGFMSSNRKNGEGDDDIYRVNLSPLAGSFGLNGVITDKNTNEKLEGVTIQLISPEGEKITETLTDAEGSFRLPVEQSRNYTLLLSREDYFNGTLEANTEEAQLWKPLNIEGELEQDPKVSLDFTVLDKDNATPLSPVEVIIVDKVTGDTLRTYQVDESGKFSLSLANKRLGDEVSYDIILKKQGYVAGKKTYNGEISKSGPIAINDFLKTEMAKIDKGKDLGSMIDLKPIYFDFAKFNIREDAEVELKKIAEILNDNPEMVIELGSHTDSRGKSSRNYSLSKKRAKSSANYLKERISNPSRISSKGYGETKPVIICDSKNKCSEEDHAKNRRTEFRIVKY